MRIRLPFLIVATFGVGLAYPPSRTQMTEWLQPLTDPAKRWMTRQELRQIASDFDLYIEGRGNAPLRRGEFDSWLDRRYPQERSRVDSWDSRYVAEMIRSRFRIVSTGPDRRLGTSDDLSWEQSPD